MFYVLNASRWICLGLALAAGEMSAQQISYQATRQLVLPNAPSATVDESSSADLDEPQQNPPAQNTPAQTGAPQQQPTPAAPETDQQRHDRAERELKAEEQQRMLGLIPNFNTVLGGSAAPLTSGEKFHLFLKSSIDPFQFFAAGVDAGIEQAEDSYPEYGEGAKGYAKRYGAAFVDGFDGNLFGNAVLPSLLHQDPRYFRLGQGSLKRRLWYSVISTVRCKGDNGNWQPNYSNVLGNLIGGAISNAYYPASDRGLGLTFERGFTVTAEGAIGSLAVEFYPDVINHFRKKKTLPPATTP